MSDFMGLCNISSVASAFVLMGLYRGYKLSLSIPKIDCNHKDPGISVSKTRRHISKTIFNNIFFRTLLKVNPNHLLFPKSRKTKISQLKPGMILTISGQTKIRSREGCREA